MSTLDQDRWCSMTFVEQMANIGSEVGRTGKWMMKGKPQLAMGAFYRALDLIDITILWGRHGLQSRGAMLRELCRARELFCGAYESSDIPTMQYLDKYFGKFAIAQRRAVI